MVTNDLLGLSAATLNYNDLALNVAIAIGLSILTRLFYLRFGQSLSNKMSFSRIFIPLSLTTLLIISVVKSSLALSLGLVGALSIVRFRTAIKDPEELIYLLVCIAIGLGLGADQRILTSSVIAVTLVTLAANALWTTGRKEKRAWYVVIRGDQVSPEVAENLGIKFEVKRLLNNNGGQEACLIVRDLGKNSVSQLQSQLSSSYAGCEISVMEHDI